MSDHGQVENRVKQVVSKQLNQDVSKIGLDSKLEEDLGMDSFGAIEMVFAIEDEFKIKVPDKEISRVKTVRDVVDFVATQVA